VIVFRVRKLPFSLKPYPCPTTLVNQSPCQPENLHGAGGSPNTLTLQGWRDVLCRAESQLTKHAVIQNQLTLGVAPPSNLSSVRLSNRSRTGLLLLTLVFHKSGANSVSIRRMSEHVESSCSHLALIHPTGILQAHTSRRWRSNICACVSVISTGCTGSVT
jgi:hypothetical protein